MPICGNKYYGGKQNCPAEVGKIGMSTAITLFKIKKGPQMM
jgi:hypothetical protein